MIVNLGQPYSMAVLATADRDDDDEDNRPVRQQLGGVTDPCSTQRPIRIFLLQAPTRSKNASQVTHLEVVPGWPGI
jgi:hypothetical protein